MKHLFALLILTPSLCAAAGLTMSPSSMDLEAMQVCMNRFQSAGSIIGHVEKTAPQADKVAAAAFHESYQEFLDAKAYIYGQAFVDGMRKDAEEKLNTAQEDMRIFLKIYKKNGALAAQDAATSYALDCVGPYSPLAEFYMTHSCVGCPAQ